MNSSFYFFFQDDDGIVDKTEGRVIEAFLCLVVKLSEASFRPMFLRVRDFRVPYTAFVFQDCFAVKVILKIVELC